MGLSVNELKELKIEDLEFINKDEIKVVTYKPDRPSNQFVVQVNSKITVIHLPTGISVTEDKHRGKHLNKTEALYNLNQIISERSHD
jgi:protein subunit release factor B